MSPLTTSSVPDLQRPLGLRVNRRADVCAIIPGPAPRKHAPHERIYPPADHGGLGVLLRHSADPPVGFSEQQQFIFLLKK